jgi:hypothetical protein
MKTLHHYTSEEGHEGIIQSKSIRPSFRASNPKDARFGDGQYLSDILSGTKRPGQLSMLFFGMPFAGRRFTHYVSINTKGLDVVFGRQSVYVVKNSGPLDISKRLVPDAWTRPATARGG